LLALAEFAEPLLLKPNGGVQQPARPSQAWPVAADVPARRPASAIRSAGAPGR